MKKSQKHVCAEKHTWIFEHLLLSHINRREREKEREGERERESITFYGFGVFFCIPSYHITCTLLNLCIP